MWRHFIIGLIFPTLVSFKAYSVDSLPALNVDKSSITVSGISAGAFMAVQLGVAYSSQIKGVAAIAGGIYGCSGGRADTALNVCMKNPGEIETQNFVNLAQENYKKNLIDDPANLAQQRVFILNGTEDKTVFVVSGQKLEEFYQSFQATPRTEYSLKMGHGFPSPRGKNKCEQSKTPWLNNCNYDGAKEILETFYGPLIKASAKKNGGDLLTFDQTEFLQPGALMSNRGNLYVPKVCRQKGAQCRLHIALHGCVQGPDIVGNAFIQDAGYNEWALQNKIVVLYPAVSSSLMNPNGCWDWYGYTDDDYATKNSLQMTAIMSMVQRLTEN